MAKCFINCEWEARGRNRNFQFLKSIKLIKNFHFCEEPKNQILKFIFKCQLSDLESTEIIFYLEQLGELLQCNNLLVLFVHLKGLSIATSGSNQVRIICLKIFLPIAFYIKSKIFCDNKSLDFLT